MTQKKIAIACQGGGSQTAFTAGVLISLLKNKLIIVRRGKMCSNIIYGDIDGESPPPPFFHYKILTEKY